MRVDLPVDAHIPHDYVPGERLRLEAYRKIAAAADAEGAGRGRRRSCRTATASPPLPVRRLFAVAAFRQTCRRARRHRGRRRRATLIRFAPLDAARLAAGAAQAAVPEGAATRR